MLWAGLVAVVALLACAGPVPPEAPTPAPPTAPPPTPDVTEVAEETGLSPEQLVPIENGFVAARWAEADQLELVWLRPGDLGHEVVRLAVRSERRMMGAAGTSINPVICPATTGLPWTFFLFGQATPYIYDVVLSGPVATGGTVVEGVYALVVEESDAERAADWTMYDGYGRRMATSYRPWFTDPPPPPVTGSLCSIVH